MKIIVNIIKVFILAVATISSCSLYANESAREAQTEWQRALDAYSAKEYDEAKAAFEKVQAMGYASADLYYNLGNVYFKLGQQHAERPYANGELGRAILNYRRALKLDPTMEDARYNLDIAHDHTNDTEPMPLGVMGSMWLAVSGIISSNGWAATSIVSLVAALILIMFYLLSSLIALRKVAFFSSIFLIFVFVLSTAFAISQRRASEQSSEAVILCNDICPVHASPDNTSKVIRQPSQGVSVKILRNHGTWSEIEFVDGEKGWITSKSVELI
jgi:tetratricopeptide (TPR) repeat protein